MMIYLSLMSTRLTAITRCRPSLVTGMRQESCGFTSVLLLNELALKYFKHKTIKDN